MSSLLTQMQADSPVGLWPLTDALGSTTAQDASGFGQTMAVTGTTFGDTGLIPGEKTALLSGGTGIRIATPNARLNVTTGTLVAWVRGPTASWGTTGGTGIVQLSHTYNMLWKGTGVGVLHNAYGSWAYEGGAGALGDNTTKQLALVFETGVSATVYLNGVLLVTFALGSFVYNGSAPLVIGDEAGRQSGIKFGYVGVYGTKLSLDRIKAQYQAGLRGGVVMG